MTQPRLSVIIVVYNMRRAAPRSLRSLSPAYQHLLEAQDYEIVVVENGSSEPLEPEELALLAPNISYHRLENPPPSPAFAVNFGVARARGEVLAIMVDGAHMLTPGVLHYGLELYGALPNPLVVTKPFYLGPGPQYETIFEGYDETREDQMLAGINWPEEGYRLFEIGVPIRVEPRGVRPPLYWFIRQFESNCLFMRRSAFEAIGGCEERFDIPGGGIMLPDLYLRLTELPDSQIVQLLGEASFHQLHGGTSTNVSREQQKAQWQRYLEQYEQLRGKPYKVSQNPISYYGHMPNEHARQLMLTG